MERELWPPLYHLLLDTATGFRQKYVQHQPWVLAAVVLWAALHDRPVSWACQRRHWSTTTLRPGRLPSPATVSRRAAGSLDSRSHAKLPASARMPSGRLT